MKIQRFYAPLLPESRNLLALCFLGLTAFNGLSFILVMFTAFRVNTIATRKTTFVQLINGETISVTEKDRYWRYPAVIQKLVSDWTTLTFSWDNTIAGTSEKDKGVRVDGGKMVTTNTWFASLLMEPEFGKASLKKLALLTPSTVFSGQIRSTAIISYLSEPREIRTGEWEVDLVATRLIIDRNTGRDERIPFNRTFTIKAVEIPRSPLGTSAPLIEQKIYEIRSSGLEITKITEFTPK